MPKMLVNQAKRNMEEFSQERSIIDTPPEMFSPHRFVILNTLLLHGVLDFMELKNAINAKTDGHLASHLRALEKTGILENRKEIEDKRKKTFYMLTRDGEEKFLQLINALEISLKEIESYKK